ncbi:selenocysteine-specific translation elongation factor [Terrabacter lapilli]|uniref:Selenocysteine-specific elongation factor n=1 Tax=Terrabacter lapilli TaxID=436231 RepID=A0ABP5DIS7_9MICO
MHVLATAGHVDHGKSALVRALTGIEPDRWEEEHRRGLTIDLGYAWTTLPTGAEVAFVDVPGHQRFIGNMLAGLGPAPAVLFVVAADEGWRQQSEEHLAAVRALGLRHGVLAVTRSDLANPQATLEDARQRLRAAGLEGEAVAVSARTGRGMDELKDALGRLVADLPAPDTRARARLWVDRSFTIRGSGTVVTGTLGQGRIAVGDRLVLARGGHRDVEVTVRGLQSLEQPRETVEAVARVAVNLRGLGAEEVRRGDVLLAAGRWHTTSVVDVALDPPVAREAPTHVMAHVGTLALETRLRPLSDRLARLSFPRVLPLQAGDRVILRDPGAQTVLAGARVLDTDPPELTRRGAAQRRATELAALAEGDGIPDLSYEVHRRGVLAVAEAVALGHALGDEGDPAPGVLRRGQWLVAEQAWHGWTRTLREALEQHAHAHPMQPTLSLEAARAAAGVPDRELLADVAAAGGLEVVSGRVGIPGVRATLDPSVEAALVQIERRLADQPFTAPEQHELDAAGLGPRQLAAAESAGRLVRLTPEIVLLPTAPARAMRVLAGLPQPFTTSEARLALDSTRRTVIPLLEHLDGRGWTRRLDGSHREVRR